MTIGKIVYERGIIMNVLVISMFRYALEKQKAILRDKYSREHRYAVKKLVSNWSTIKPQIEEAINRLMTEKMQTAENRLNDVLEMNEQLANFVA